MEEDTVKKVTLCRCVAATLLLPLCACDGAGVTRTRACAIDQKPSMSADGLRARVNTEAPASQAQFSTWSIFVFGPAYHAGHAVTLSEDRGEVARTLTPAEMRRPWRWRFGDGATAYGWTVRHAYASPTWRRIEVDAYDPAIKRWFVFDRVSIRVQR